MGLYVCQPCAEKHGLSTRPITRLIAVCEVCVERDGNYHDTKPCLFTDDITRPVGTGAPTALEQLSRRADPPQGADR